MTHSRQAPLWRQPGRSKQQTCLLTDGYCWSEGWILISINCLLRNCSTLLPGTISPTANLIGLRSEHTARLLNTGQVLITGGLDANSNYLATAELYH